jgi:GDPmannose 4,6-dehydratase
MKKALIFGISGQDGAYLAKLLLSKKYIVYGTSRDAQVSSFGNLEQLGIRDKVQLESAALNDFRSVLQVLFKTHPDEVYNLAGQTSVGLSFEQPVETLESIAIGTLNILEAIRFIGEPIKFYNAASSEIFGDTSGSAANEVTSFSPRSPYAVAKATAFWEVANYREAYGLFACSGILFNHDSPLRPERFVTQKIVSSACRIAAGKQDKLFLGNINIQRDWGWAEDYVEAMYLMLQQDHSDDYVIATGESYKLAEFIEIAFSLVGLNWHDCVISDNNLCRPTDIAISRGDPKKAKECLGWEARHKLNDIVKLMVQARQSLSAGNTQTI